MHTEYGTLAVWAGRRWDGDGLAVPAHACKILSVRTPNYFVYESKFCYLERRKIIIGRRDCNDEHPMPKCSVYLLKSGQAVENGVVYTNTNSVVNSLTIILKIFHLEMLTQSGSFLVHVSRRNLRQIQQAFQVNQSSYYATST